MSVSPHGVPKRIGRYIIVKRLSKERMGAVYKARDTNIDRTVRLRTFELDIPTDSPDYAAFRQRFLDPDRIQNTLNHPNILAVFERGESEGITYIATEFVEGESLAEILGIRPRPRTETALRILGQTARAVNYAHRKGIIHRDIKPSNILIHDNGKVKLTDIGMSLFLEAVPAHLDLDSLIYMSPEQIRGHFVDGKTDVFSLGMVAFEVLSGDRPFPGDSATSILYKIVHSRPVRPANLEALGLDPKIWDEVFSKVLAKHPAGRYETAARFFSDLERCLVSSFREEEIAPTVLFDRADKNEVGKQILDEDVQFTSYRPKAMCPEHRYPEQ